MVKLNLGCGIYYKPGYVNIDKYESLVADQQTDLFTLPYSDDSVDEIEASHIIEHFDFVHIPYLLAEWWRVLKPGGKLQIETPNLLKSTLRLHLRNQEQSNRTGRFLFGVDMPGNFHKSGFTYRTLRSILIKNGFTRIKREKQHSFKTEPGMRISATKSPNLTNLLGKLRVKIIHDFPPPNTMFYAAVDTNVFDVLQSQNFDSLEQITTKISIFHPKVAILLSDVFPKSKQGGLNTKLYEFMEKNDFPSLFYTNWIRRAKSQNNILQDYYQFMDYWSKRILTVPKKSSKFSEYFSYILSMDNPKSIDYFCLESLVLESQKLCNVAIKKFHEDSIEEALEKFSVVIKINPSHEIAFWNLARIYSLSNDHSKSINSYKKALEMIRERKLRKKLMQEFNNYLSTRQSPTNPIQIRY